MILQYCFDDLIFSHLIVTAYCALLSRYCKLRLSLRSSLFLVLWSLRLRVFVLLRSIVSSSVHHGIDLCDVFLVVRSFLCFIARCLQNNVKIFYGLFDIPLLSCMYTEQDIEVFCCFCIARPVERCFRYVLGFFWNIYFSSFFNRYRTSLGRLPVAVSLSLTYLIMSWSKELSLSLISHRDTVLSSWLVIIVRSILLTFRPFRNLVLRPSSLKM